MQETRHWQAPLNETWFGCLQGLAHRLLAAYLECHAATHACSSQRLANVLLLIMPPAKACDP
eukprot:8089055-Heterocapsa_arctica.AAC.1